jgi:hypothetical protein
MTTRRWLSSVLIVALVSALVPASGWAAEAPADKDTKPVRLQAAIRQAAAAAAARPDMRLQTKAPARSSGARMQSSGGGHTGTIISLVSMAVGVGATVYMVKEMNKTTKAATSGQ